MTLHLIAPDGILGSCGTKYFKSQGMNPYTYGRSGSTASFSFSIHHPRYDMHWIEPGDYVLNCLGVLKPAIEDNGAAETIAANAVFPQMLSDICEERKAKVIHFSSDCVFSGDLDLPNTYVETSIPDATDLYGKSKSFVPEYGMTLRTSFIGHENRSKPRGLLQWILNHDRGAVVPGYTNCWWNGLTTYHLMKCVHTIIDDNLYENGLFHIHSIDGVSKWNICNIVNEEYNLSLNVEEAEATEIMGTNIDGNLNRMLGSNYDLCKSLKIPHIITQIEEYKEWHESVS